MNSTPSARPLISNVQRFSVDDGPGIRTTVFFKGCNLGCRWCHNPENISFMPSLQFTASSCVQCGRCRAVCKHGVHFISETDHAIDRSCCIQCGDCAQACLSDALELVGEYYPPQRVFDILKKDQAYYETSNGGVTFSGGEPMLFPEYLLRILTLCKKQRIHTAVDTAGHVPFSHFEQILNQADLFLYDLKFFDQDRHKKGTGVDNGLIKKNVWRLSEHGAKIIIRIPVIPGFNARLDELDALAGFIASLPCPVELVQLLPYHCLGLGKYQGLGINYTMDAGTPPSGTFMENALGLFQEKRINARIS